MRILILGVMAVVAVGCTGGSSEQSTIANDPKLQHLKDQVEREAGFTRVELFYAGFTFRGWVAR